MNSGQVLEYSIYGYHYRALTQFRYQRLENCLEDEPRVRPPICRSLQSTLVVYFDHNITHSGKGTSSLLNSSCCTVTLLKRLTPPLGPFLVQSFINAPLLTLVNLCSYPQVQISQIHFSSFFGGLDSVFEALVTFVFILEAEPSNNKAHLQ